MGVTQIGLNAADVTLALRRGEETPAGQVELVITDHASQYEVSVTGTAQTLRQLVVEGLSLPVPDGVPLVDDDYEQLRRTDSNDLTPEHDG